jgi:hypothetical protein
MATTVNEIKQTLAEQQEDVRKSVAWNRFLRNHRDVEANDANYNFFLRAFGDTYDDQLGFDSDGLEMLYNDADFRSKIATSAEDEEHNKLSKQTLELLVKARSPEQLDAERKRLAYTSVEELRAQHARLTELKALERNNTRQELHQMSRTAQRTQYAPPVIPAELTRRAFAKMGIEEQRKAVRMFTGDRLNKKWASEEGR